MKFGKKPEKKFKIQVDDRAKDFINQFTSYTLPITATDVRRMRDEIREIQERERISLHREMEEGYARFHGISSSGGTLFNIFNGDNE